MKIAIFSDTFPPHINGVANVAYRSAIELASAGHEVNVFTASNSLHKEYSDTSFVKKNGFNLIRIPSIPAFVYPGFRLAFPLGASSKFLKKIKPDIIHTHTPLAIGWRSVFAAKLLHIPIVGTHHTFYNHYLKHARLDYNWAKKISWRYVVGYYNRCDVVFSPSKSLADELISHGLKKPIKVLPNSVDKAFCKKISLIEKKKLKKSFGISGKSLVYMGRISYEKSVDQVVKAVGQVVKKMPKITLLIVGDGPEKKSLEKLVGDLGIKKNVIFTGFLEGGRLVESLQASDIFVTASKTENMPLSVLEAMSASLPVVAADALGIPEIVKNNVNGFLVKPNDPKDMARKIIKVLSDDKVLDRFSNGSTTMSAYFSEKIATQSLEEIYEELIAKKNENLSLSRVL